MLLIIGMNSISVTCYNSIYVVFLLLPTCNIYRVLTVVRLKKVSNDLASATERPPILLENNLGHGSLWKNNMI